MGGSAATGTGGSAATGAGAQGGTSVLLPTGGSGGRSNECARDPYRGEIKPLDILLLLDRSDSMGADGYWVPVTQAIKDFLALPGASGLGMGLRLFPVAASVNPVKTCTDPVECVPYECQTSYSDPFGPKLCNAGFTDSCVITDYQNPQVGIAPLPGVASSIEGAINAVTADGNYTPTYPALAGAMLYAKSWAANHPDHITAIVLATDGLPSACNPNDLSTIAAKAEEGFSSTPSVRTFVLGIGDLVGLSQVALAGSGGTQDVIPVSATNPDLSFLDALNRVRGGLACTYGIPVPGNGAAVDPKLVNVEFTPDGGALEVIPRVTDADCAGQGGWFYDDPNAPTEIVLCPASCATVTSGAGNLDVVLGCETIVR